MLAWSSIALVLFSSLENNEYAGIPSGGVRSELRDAYDDTSAALKYLIAVACLVLVTEIAAMVFQIIVIWLELKEFQPVSLLFHIPVSHEIFFIDSHLDLGVFLVEIRT